MPKRLELTFSPQKDGEIVRYLQLNKDIDTSPMLICAIEYYLATGGEYMNIGTVCTKAITDTKTVRKPIYVPMNSIVGPWADNLKVKKQGLLSVKVRQILKNSLIKTDNEAEEKTTEYEDCVLEVDKVLESASITITKAEMTPKPAPAGKKKSSDDMLDGFARVVKESSDNSGLEEESDLIKDQEEQKRSSSSLMDKLMPQGEW